MHIFNIQLHARICMLFYVLQNRNTLTICIVFLWLAALDIIDVWVPTHLSTLCIYALMYHVMMLWANGYWSTEGPLSSSNDGYTWLDSYDINLHICIFTLRHQLTEIIAYILIHPPPNDMTVHICSWRSWYPASYTPTFLHIWHKPVEIHAKWNIQRVARLRSNKHSVYSPPT